MGLSARRLNALTRPEVGEEVRAERRVDVHGRVDAGVHLLLDEGGVEVAGVEGDEAHPGLGRRGAHREPERGQETSRLSARAHLPQPGMTQGVT